MARLIWTVKASRDFDAVCAYLDANSPGYTRTFARGVSALAEDAARQPFFGAEVEKYGREDIRERLFDSFRVIYRVRGNEVEILTVVHAAKLLPRLPPGDTDPA